MKQKLPPHGSFTFKPSTCNSDANKALSSLFVQEQNQSVFNRTLRDTEQLQRYFENYLRFCSPPWCSERLHITKESIHQSELWLPLEEIRKPFYKIIRSSLTFEIEFSYTIFETSSCWFQIVAEFPEWLQRFKNPSLLLQKLSNDIEFRLFFIFWLFMPQRYYGREMNRYPEQTNYIDKWVQERKSNKERIRCLDAACGDGRGTYHLAKLLLAKNIKPEDLYIEGWTLNPLELYSASFFTQKSYHKIDQKMRLERETIFKTGLHKNIRFSSRDILKEHPNSEQPFDLILCNGLLGGPIINTAEELHKVIKTLANHLSTDGLFLVANHFHAGWKKKCKNSTLINMMMEHGIEAIEVKECVGGIKKGSFKKTPHIEDSYAIRTVSANRPMKVRHQTP